VRAQDVGADAADQHADAPDTARAEHDRVVVVLAGLGDDLRTGLA
jgi:hypothetical protein